MYWRLLFPKHVKYQKLNKVEVVFETNDSNPVSAKRIFAIVQRKKKEPENDVAASSNQS